MRQLFSIRNLLAITHLSVFLFTALFIGFSTYFITKDALEEKNKKGLIPQISEKVSAQQAREEYLIYEKREVLTFRPNNLNKERVTGYAKNTSDSAEHLIYSFIDDPLNESLRRTVPTVTLLKNNLIFLNGVGGAGYVVLTLTGDNVTMDYPALKNRNFPLANALFTEEKELIYAYGGPNSKEKDSRHKIYWKKNNKETEELDASSFPSGEFWLQPVGWSLENNKFYAQRQSDSKTYAKLWKISLADQKIAPIESVKGAFINNTKICSAQDYAVFISTAIDPTEKKHGAPIGPSKLAIANLSTDTVEVIFTSDKLISDPMVSCASNKILVKENNRFRVFDANGKEFHRTFIFGAPLFFSNDGKTLAVKNNDKFLLININNGKRAAIGEDAMEDGKTKIRYNLLGFTSQ